jgi:DNA end-binding protein Ku
MVLITLRAEVLPAELALQGRDRPGTVAIVRMIIERRSGTFDPSTFRVRYQEALRELIEAKMRGLPVKPTPVAAPNLATDLMAALKRSLARETGEPARTSTRNAVADRRQRSLRLRVSG